MATQIVDPQSQTETPRVFASFGAALHADHTGIRPDPAALNLDPAQPEKSFHAAYESLFANIRRSLNEFVRNDEAVVAEFKRYGDAADEYLALGIEQAFKGLNDLGGEIELQHGKAATLAYAQQLDAVLEDPEQRIKVLEAYPDAGRDCFFDFFLNYHSSKDEEKRREQTHMLERWAHHFADLYAGPIVRMGAYLEADFSHPDPANDAQPQPFSPSLFGQIFPPIWLALRKNALALLALTQQNAPILWARAKTNAAHDMGRVKELALKGVAHWLANAKHNYNDFKGVAVKALRALEKPVFHSPFASLGPAFEGDDVILGGTPIEPVSQSEPVAKPYRLPSWDAWPDEPGADEPAAKVEPWLLPAVLSDEEQRAADADRIASEAIARAEEAADAAAKARAAEAAEAGYQFSTPDEPIPAALTTSIVLGGKPINIDDLPQDHPWRSDRPLAFAAAAAPDEDAPSEVIELKPGTLFSITNRMNEVSIRVFEGTKTMVKNAVAFVENKPIIGGIAVAAVAFATIGLTFYLMRHGVHASGTGAASHAADLSHATPLAPKGPNQQLFNLLQQQQNTAQHAAQVAANAAHAAAESADAAARAAARTTQAVAEHSSHHAHHAAHITGLADTVQNLPEPSVTANAFQAAADPSVVTAAPAADVAQAAPSIADTAQHAVHAVSAIGSADQMSDSLTAIFADPAKREAFNAAFAESHNTVDAARHALSALTPIPN